MSVVTVAIPTLNGARWLPGVLGAIRSQRLDHELELLVCDSGSVDGTRELVAHAGARVLEIEPQSFSHGAVRNLLMEHARGEFVAMLSQDAEPVDALWLARILQGFELAADVALVYGPYIPRPDCPWREAAHLRRFFAALSPDGEPRIDRLTPLERSTPPRELFGPRTYFTDANGCLRREAWQSINYPSVAHAEDHALAVRMLQAGYAKVFIPAAGALHSHHYSPMQRLRRDFDDWRGILEVYGWREPAGIAHIVLQLRGAAGSVLRVPDMPPSRVPWELAAAVVERALHLVGAILGSRSDRLPAWLRRHLSLEGRDSFRPLQPTKAAVPAHSRR
jgi:rhamnosyltransferase